MTPGSELLAYINMARERPTTKWPANLDARKRGREDEEFTQCIVFHFYTYIQANEKQVHTKLEVFTGEVCVRQVGDHSQMVVIKPQQEKCDIQDLNWNAGRERVSER